MADPVEVELKLELDPADHSAIAGAPMLGADSGNSDQLISTYFDTPDLALRKRG